MLKTLFNTEYNQSGLSAKLVAQKHLEGITHYCDDNTLKGFNAKIVKCSAIDEGKLLGLIEHLPVGGWDNAKMYRYVFFSVDGMGIRDETTYTTKKQAEKAFWEFANSLDADSIYSKAITNLIKWREQEIEQLKEALK